MKSLAASYHHPQQKMPGAKGHPLAFENLSWNSKRTKPCSSIIQPCLATNKPHLFQPPHLHFLSKSYHKQHSHFSQTSLLLCISVLLPKTSKWHEPCLTNCSKINCQTQAAPKPCIWPLTIHLIFLSSKGTRQHQLEEGHRSSFIETAPWPLFKNQLANKPT